MECRCFFFFSSRRRHTRSLCDWSSDVCSSDLQRAELLGDVVACGPGTLGDGEGGHGQHLLGLAPGGETAGHVAPRDEDQLVLRRLVTEQPKGIDGVRRPRALELDPRDLEARVARNRGVAQGQAYAAARVLRRLLVRRHVGGDPQDDVGVELRVGLLSADEMRHVRWVERATEDADAALRAVEPAGAAADGPGGRPHLAQGRTWPAPSTTYL